MAEAMNDLLPALIAKLDATGLAELEVREDALRIRLRRSPDVSTMLDRRAAERAPRADRSWGAAGMTGPAHPGLTPVGPGRELREGRDGRAGGDPRDPARPEARQSVATSPAVGIYHPAPAARPGTRVRAGDRLGAVDMLGVPQEVVAPVDGVIGASLVDSGDAVEYGQELVVIEFAGAATQAEAPPHPPTPTDR